MGLKYELLGQKDLEELYEKKVNQLNEIKLAMDVIEHDNNIPLLKEKYEGKYFKFMNSVSCDEKWPVYTYCKEVININEAVVDSIQKNHVGEIVIIIDKNGYFFLFQEEITKREYETGSMNIIEECYKLIRW